MGFVVCVIHYLVQFWLSNLGIPWQDWLFQLIQQTVVCGQSIQNWPQISGKFPTQQSRNYRYWNFVVRVLDRTASWLFQLLLQPAVWSINALPIFSKLQQHYHSHRNHHHYHHRCHYHRKLSSPLTSITLLLSSVSKSLLNWTKLWISLSSSS